MDDPAGLKMALTVASWGWRVAPGFCSKAGEKVPLAGDWVNNATTDPDKLRAWWDARGWLWPGVVSGVHSCIVLDCDRPSSVSWLRECASSEGWPSGGLVYRTPGRGGGLHCLWTWPDYLGRDFRQAKVRLPDGGEIQIRGNGHWTLLAGAWRPDGKYEIVEEPGESGPVTAPEGLIRKILAESVVSVGRTRSTELESISPEDAWAGAPYTDDRKNLTAGLAWYLAIRGADLDEVTRQCVAFGRECCIPPLADETCEKKAEYAVKRAEQYKRQSEEEMRRTLGFLVENW